MTDFVEAHTRGAPRARRPSTTNEASGVELPRVRVSVISDAICPWCWVGKRRLERAIAALNGQADISVTWLPFELNPQMPEEGMDRRSYRSAKFGSWERSKSLDRQVAEVGAGEGLAFRHDLIERAPNTLNTHRLIWLAGQHDVQEVVVEGVFTAYFVAGRDIGRTDVLADIAAAAGLDREEVERSLTGAAGAAEVREAMELVRRAGVRGVPTFLLNGELSFSGALQTERLEDAIRKAAAIDG